MRMETREEAISGQPDQTVPVLARHTSGRSNSCQHVLKKIGVFDADSALLLPLSLFLPWDRCVGFNSPTFLSTKPLCPILNDNTTDMEPKELLKELEKDPNNLELQKPSL